jgi:bifunctional DNA-binding transcriptional regulator/antitoxin component of YhaV-PrlF toxin-antitoxin module
VHRPSFQAGLPGQSREFVLVDSSGRLQIPREYLDHLNIHQRAVIHFDGDRVIIVPEDADDGR